MIEKYFEFLKELAITNPIVKEFRLIREFSSLESGFIRFAVKFIDGSELHVFEHVTSTLRKTDYSYHWQDGNKQLILRWDNAPHHPEIKTFPHHRHEGSEVKDSDEPTLAEILRKIEKIILEM